MNKLIITEEGKITYNNQNVENLNTDFLFEIFKQMLNENVSIEGDDKNQIFQLFKKMDEETKDGAQFKEFWKKQKEEYNKLEAQIANIDSSN